MRSVKLLGSRRGDRRSARHTPTARRRPGAIVFAISTACVLAAGTVLVDASPSSAKVSAATNSIITIAGPAAGLGSPQSAAFDPHGNLIVADENNNVIKVVAASKGTFYGQSMVPGGVYTIVSGLSGPNGVAVDPQGDIAITDTGDNEVIFIPPVGGNYFGSTLSAGQIFPVAEGVATSPSSITSVAPWYSAGLNSPDGIAFDARGDLVIADTFNDVVRFMPRAGGVFFGRSMSAGNIYTIAGDTVNGYSGDGGPADLAQLAMDNFDGIGVDPNGNVVFSDVDNMVVRVVANVTGSFQGRAVTAGDIYTIAGDTNEGFKGDKKPATKAWLDTPQGIAVDGSDNVLISDSNNNRIRVVAGAAGTYDGMHVKMGDIYTVPGTAGLLNGLGGISLGPSSQIVIPDGTDNVVLELADVPPVPSVAGLKPAFGPISGDRKVTITGTGLAGAREVLFGSRPATSFAVKSNKKIIAFSPVGTLGTVVVSVVASTGAGGGYYTYQLSAGKTKHAAERRSVPGWFATCSG